MFSLFNNEHNEKKLTWPGLTLTHWSVPRKLCHVLNKNGNVLCVISPSFLLCLGWSWRHQFPRGFHALLVASQFCTSFSNLDSRPRCHKNPEEDSGQRDWLPLNDLNECYSSPRQDTWTRVTWAINGDKTWTSTSLHSRFFFVEMQILILQKTCSPLALFSLVAFLYIAESYSSTQADNESTSRSRFSS